MFKFEDAIELFLKALSLEKEHSNIILRNLIKTVIKFIKKEDSDEFNDQSDFEIETQNLLKLIELSDILIKKRKIAVASKLLNYVYSLDDENYQVKTELLLTSAKLFKLDSNHEQAILAYEECYYLASAENDQKLRVKCMVSISSCYLEQSDLNKAIVYYHKLLDIETYLSNESLSARSSENSDDKEEEMAINLELSIAIRQNLFTAHLRLGKLRVCCYYLKEIVDIIDKYLSTNYDVTFYKSFEFAQIKMDSSLELLKLYMLFGEFILMEKVLNGMLKFIETVIDTNEDEEIQKLTEKQLNSLKYFKLKSYSYLGICMAGLREFRFSKLCTRKCLCLLDRELENVVKLIESKGNEKVEGYRKDLYALKTLKVEFLCDASLASSQYVKTFKEMYTHNIDLLLNNDLGSQTKFDLYELNKLAEMYQEGINYSKNAYLLSKALIDPNLRAEATFGLAISLYGNEQYQSAAYYFNEVLSISSILLDTKYHQGSGDRFYLDVAPDYHLEAGIYLAKCQLLADFYEIEQLYSVKTDSEATQKNLNENSKKNQEKEKKTSKEGVTNEKDCVLTDQKSLPKQPTLQLDTMYTKLTKYIDTLLKFVLNWKSSETNRSSFLFSLSEIERIKHDRDSERLRTLLDLCTESLVYVCYKLEKYTECIIFMELSDFIFRTSFADLDSVFDLKNFNYIFTMSLFFKSNLNQLQSSLLRYRFIFDSKILYIFLLESISSTEWRVVKHKKQRLNSLLSSLHLSFDTNHVKLVNSSKFEYLYKKFEIIQNEWVKANLNDIEYRHAAIYDSTLDVMNLRIKNRLKECRYFNYLQKINKGDSKISEFNYEFQMSSIDLLNLKLSEKLSENLSKTRLVSSGDGDDDGETSSTASQSSSLSFVSLNQSLIQLTQIFYSILIKPIEHVFHTENGDLERNLSILIESKYIKVFTYIINYSQDQMPLNQSFHYLMMLDSFLKQSTACLMSYLKDTKKDQDLASERQKVIDTPNRSKQISSKLDMENSTSTVRVKKHDILPRLTCHPRLAVKMLNENPDLDYVEIRNDAVQRVKDRLDKSVSTLISSTISGTDVKRSTLEIVDYKQVNSVQKSCVIGCPELVLPNAKFNTFLKIGFEHMQIIGESLYTEPIFSTRMTKSELAYQLETNNVIFLTTYSTNEEREDHSFLVCSNVNVEQLSATHSSEYNKYTRLDLNDLERIDMHQCDLLVLNCYSTLTNKPRVNLAKKMLARGCKSILIVLSPLTNKLMIEFFYLFLHNVKKGRETSSAYAETIKKLAIVNSKLSVVKNLIYSSFCLIGSKSINIPIKAISHSIVQNNIDHSLKALNLEHSRDFLNFEDANIKPFSILAPNYVTNLEINLKQLQLLTKFLLNQLIIDSKTQALNKNDKYQKIFIYLADLVSKAIFYIKANKVQPETLSELIDENVTALNLLKCLGFSIQPYGVHRNRDVKDRKVLIFPDNRYLDLNLRLTHVFACLVDLCFYYDENAISTVDSSMHSSFYKNNSSNTNKSGDKKKQNSNTTSNTNGYSMNGLLSNVSTSRSNLAKDSLNSKIKCIVFNLEALLPIEDTKLLESVIDILALTKFTPEIVLSTTDQSIFYAFTYYEKFDKTKHDNKLDLEILMNLDLLKWDLSKTATFKGDSKHRIKNNAELMQSEVNVKYSVSNKVVNFLLSIGFEIIGTWLRFNDNEMNRNLLDLILKIFTSFNVDRDMSLYQELQINVLGQRSAQSKELFLRTHSSKVRKNNSTIVKNEEKIDQEHDMYNFFVTTPWCSSVESKEHVKLKMTFIEKYIKISKELSQQRADTLRHYFNYALKQSVINELDDRLEENFKYMNDPAEVIKKVKFKPGGTPSRDRIIVNEKLNLTLAQIEEIRKYSHAYCQRNIEKINIDLKERTQKLMLPKIKMRKS